MGELVGSILFHQLLLICQLLWQARQAVSDHVFSTFERLKDVVVLAKSLPSCAVLTHITSKIGVLTKYLYKRFVISPRIKGLMK